MNAPRAITQHDDRTLKIVWDDGRAQLYDVVYLRRNCPCAACAEQKTAAADKIQTDDRVRPTEIKSVGRYALLIAFSDGHRTGIYSFETLRKFSGKL